MPRSIESVTSLEIRSYGDDAVEVNNSHDVRSVMDPVKSDNIEDALHALTSAPVGGVVYKGKTGMPGTNSVVRAHRAVVWLLTVSLTVELDEMVLSR